MIQGEMAMRGKNALKLASVLMAFILVGCSTSSPIIDGASNGAEVGFNENPPTADGAPAPPAHASEPYYFRDLDTLVATSDAVVEGVVVAVERGDMLGDSEAFQLQLREVQIEVREVLHGEADPKFVVYELGWGSKGQPIEANGVRASNLGDRGLYFLQRAKAGGAPVEQGSFTVINSQGRYLQGRGELLTPATEEDGLSKELASRGSTQLKAEIAQASQRTKSGDARPQLEPVPER